MNLYVMIPGDICYGILNLKKLGVKRSDIGLFRNCSDS